MNSLVKKTGVYFIGNMASKVTSALIIPIYAYFVSSGDLGEYDYLTSIMQMFAPVAFLAVWEAVLRYILREDDTEEASRCVSNVIAMAFVAIAIIVIGSLAASAVGLLSLKAAVRLMAMTAAYGLVQVWQYLSRALKESELYAFSGALGALVNFAMILLLVCLLGMGLDGLVLSYLVGQLAILVLIEVKLNLVQSFSFSKLSAERMKKFIRFSAPLAVNLLLLTYVMSFGRILITNSLGADANGLYTFALKFGSIVTTLGSIFAMAVVEEAILRIGKPGADGFFRSIVSNTETILFSVALICLPLIRLFYYFIQSTEYAGSFNLVPIFLFYAICTVMSTIVGCVFQTAQKTNAIAATSFAGALVTTLVSMSLIESLEEFGVAVGLLSGAFAMLVVRYVLGRRLIRYPLLNAKNTLLFCILIVYAVLGIAFVSSSDVLTQVIWLAVSCAAFLPLFLKGCKRLAEIPDEC